MTLPIEIKDDNFKAALEWLIPVEGESLCHDSGGWTKYGISQRAYCPNETEAKAKEIINALTFNKAALWYFENYWTKGQLEIFKHPLSLLHFDCVVNAGKAGAVKLLQKALNDCGHPLTVDGVLGKRETIPALLRVQHESIPVLFKYCISQYQHHRLNLWFYLVYEKQYTVVNGKKVLYSQYLKGWMKRHYWLHQHISKILSEN